MSPQSMPWNSSESPTPRSLGDESLSGSYGIDRDIEAQPIAIVGLACKLPGNVTSASKFWDLLENGRSGQCDVPGSRFNVDAFYHPQGGDRPGSINTKGGYFLKDDVRAFENSFFGINNLEATSMDPQQRKLLEVVFECFESAGVPLDKVSGSNTGCYVGNFTIDYQVMQTRDPEYLSRYSATGMGTTILGNRISHAFNLLGPSLVVDTACSSSLYCLHIACTALENGECDGAVVAGANLIQSPEQHLGTMKAGVLSQTSTCHTFDSSADGYGRADGIGALYLKRLDDAIRDGDAIRSVIRATAINANGKTAGITLPSADGQEAVIRKAYAKARIGVAHTAYVECHGTGTKVGDVIEVEALSRVFRHPADAPLLIGSVKTNVGHSEAASGISSVIKTTLALEKSLIPATVGLKNINPKLKTAEWRIDIPTYLTPWPVKTSSVESIRRASVNSFGYGGANAHVILENAHAHVRFDYDEASKAQHALGLHGSIVLPFSAATSQSLDARIQDFADFEFHDGSILDLAYTLGSRRTHFAKRAYLLLPRNTTIKDGLPTQNFRTISNTATNSASRYAFVFTGQGSQWPEMCKELFDEFPVFRDAISEMDLALQSLPHPPTWTLREAIFEKSATNMIHHPTRSQPACTAIQVALVQLLASWDIHPSAALGHSSGEIAAAFATGYLSSAAAITIAYYRGYVVGRHTSQGAMIAAGLSENEAKAEISLAGFQDKIQVACINSPESVTISGDESAAETLLGVLQDRKIFARKIKTGGQAYHSHHMKALGQEYQSFLEGALPHLDFSSKLPKGAIFISSVTAERFADVGPAYWRSNLESQVRFADAVQRLYEDGDFHLIEVGPHSALELPIKQIRSSLGITEDKLRYSTAIKRNANSLESVLNLAGSLWLHGHDMSFEKVNGLLSSGKSGSKGSNYKVLHDLPSYRWHYDGVLWNESRASVEFRQRKHLRHELLGSQMPGGNGSDIFWRNVLRIDDISWLRDHKLEETVVFPGACYLSMAMEAALQASPSNFAERPTFRLENVNILTALALSAEPSANVELFTVIHRVPITYTSNSDIWWDFKIDSFQDGISVSHARGSISIQPVSNPMVSKFQAPTDGLEPSAPKMWYEKLANQGLNFGPCFQSIKEFQVSRMKSVYHCTTKAPLLQTCGDDLASYAVHPITLDAMLQTAIVATTAGNSKDLRAKVPTKISVAIIETPETSISQAASIHSLAESVGFGTSEIGAELVNSHGRVNVQLEGVRLASYEVAGQMGDSETRHPILRVLWKPDIHGLGLICSDGLSNYLDKFALEAHSDIADEGLLKLGACLSLLANKNPGLRILELGNDINDITKAALDLLSANTAFRMLRSYTVGSFSESGELLGAAVNFEDGERQGLSPVTSQVFDLVLLPNIPAANFNLENRLGLIKNLMGSSGILLALSNSASSPPSGAPELDVVQCGLSDRTTQIVLARASLGSEAHNALDGHSFVVVDQGLNQLSKTVMRNISEATGRPVTRLAINEVTDNSIVPGATVFSFIECYKPMLSTATDDEMHRIKLITNNASHIVWVTGGNLLEGSRPDFALVSGLARALMLEQPSLKFFTFDVDDIDSHVQQTAEHLILVLKQNSNALDFEFIQRQAVVHVSRFVPDDNLNESFRQKQGTEINEMPLQEAKPVKLSIERVGQFDSIFFKQVKLQGSLDATDVQVQVTSVGLNAKDFYMLAGKVDTKNATCSLEFCGIIEKIGSAVRSFAPGDRVVVMAPTHFQTSQIVPGWACQKLKDDEDFNVLSTLPVVYATALYALQDRASVQPGETVLIHSGAGGVGIAAIQIAKLAGAKVFTTVSTEAKKEFLVETFGINPANVFSSRDTSFLPSILQATNGKGVDVILNSLTGDLLHASWRCCGMFGRFVEIGKRDLIGSGRLEMDQFLKNATYTAFDMSYLYDTENSTYQAIWSRLLAEVLRLYRERKITEIKPLEVFDLSNITQALRYFSSRNRMGKVAINLENQGSVLRVQPFKYNTKFSTEKSYVMIGCLGGLGRSLSKWMISRGARKFVFLGRSGLDKEPARRLIEDLDQNGADCKVVRGDVCNVEDVTRVLDQVNGLVGGVIQAAMGLNEALFTTMPNQYWHRGIDPKVIGTWNLHNAIKGKDSEIEFFLMTSSVSGSVGTATESNYCSANYFLDVFARYRRGLGLPATSLGLGMISEVGYLHENPEIEALLLRKGIQAINEDELLQIVDIALSSSAIIPHAYDEAAHAHVLTGLEPFGLKELRKKGFEGTNPTLNDPRAAILARALDGQADLASKNQDGSLPAEVNDALEKGVLLADAILAHVTKRFSNLVLLPLAQVDVSKPLANYGMDSMIAAEFRTWFFQTFHVDIPFLTLLSKTSTLLSLSEAIVTGVEDLENN